MVLTGKQAREQSLTKLIKEIKKLRVKYPGEADALVVSRYFQNYDIFKLLKLLDTDSSAAKGEEEGSGHNEEEISELAEEMETFQMVKPGARRKQRKQRN